MIKQISVYGAHVFWFIFFFQFLKNLFLCLLPLLPSFEVVLPAILLSLVYKSMKVPKNLVSEMLLLIGNLSKDATKSKEKIVSYFLM